MYREFLFPFCDRTVAVYTETSLSKHFTLKAKSAFVFDIVKCTHTQMINSYITMNL